MVSENVREVTSLHSLKALAIIRRTSLALRSGVVFSILKWNNNIYDIIFIQKLNDTRNNLLFYAATRRDTKQNVWSKKMLARMFWVYGWITYDNDGTMIRTYPRLKTDRNNAQHTQHVSANLGPTYQLIWYTPTQFREQKMVPECYIYNIFITWMYLYTW